MKLGKSFRRESSKKVDRYTTYEHETRVKDKNRSKSIRKLRKQKEDSKSSSGL